MRVAIGPGIRLTAAGMAIGALLVAGCNQTDEGEHAAAPVTAAQASEAAPPADAPDLALDRLKATPSPLGAVERDPFRFKPKPPPPPPPPPKPKPMPLGPPAPVPPPPPPPIPLKFIGLVGTSGGRLAVFSDSKGAVLRGKEGDIIEGQYRIVRIGVESAELVYLDGRGRQVIRLSGQ